MQSTCRIANVSNVTHSQRSQRVAQYAHVFWKRFASFYFTLFLRFFNTKNKILFSSIIVIFCAKSNQYVNYCCHIRHFISKRENISAVNRSFSLFRLRSFFCYHKKWSCYAARLILRTSEANLARFCHRQCFTIRGITSLIKPTSLALRAKLVMRVTP